MIRAATNPLIPLDLVGFKYERIEVLEYLGKRGLFHDYLCKCTCGKVWPVLRQGIIQQTTKSCGCLMRDQKKTMFTTHGRTNTPEYKSWESMIERCFNPKNDRFKDYGGRGITACERWRSFENFFADMGERPSLDYSLGRKDNNKGYCPDNCRWETRKQQQRNMRSNRLLTFRGETLCVAEWCERLGINRSTLHKRISRGWSVERALTAG